MESADSKVARQGKRRSSVGEQPVRITRTIPRKLVHMLEATAAIEGCDLNEIVSKALGQYFSRHEEKDLIERVSKRRLAKAIATENGGE
jgi:hypothetical protein